jgi:hypothetical protein
MTATMRSFVLAVALLALPVAAAHAAATSTEAELKVLADTLRGNRRALVAANLMLTSEEAARFWPVYDRYQVEMDAIAKRVVTLVDEYITHFRDMSDEKALQLVTDYLATDADRVKVRQTYLPEFTKALPGRTVARFFQLENKMDAVLRYELAADPGGREAAPAGRVAHPPGARAARPQRLRNRTSLRAFAPRPHCGRAGRAPSGAAFASPLPDLGPTTARG